MSERDKVEEDDDAEDNNDESDESESESDDVDFDEDAICIYYFSQNQDTVIQPSKFFFKKPTTANRVYKKSSTLFHGLIIKFL